MYTNNNFALTSKDFFLTSDSFIIQHSDLHLLNPHNVTSYNKKILLIIYADIYTRKFFSHDNVVFTREKSRDFMANLMHKNNSFT